MQAYLGCRPRGQSTRVFLPACMSLCRTNSSDVRTAVRHARPGHCGGAASAAGALSGLLSVCNRCWPRRPRLTAEELHSQLVLIGVRAGKTAAGIAARRYGPAGAGVAARAYGPAACAVTALAAGRADRGCLQRNCTRGLCADRHAGRQKRSRRRGSTIRRGRRRTVSRQLREPESRLR